MDFNQIYNSMYNFLINWNIQNIYLKAFVIFFGFFICAEILVFILKKIVMKLASKTKTDVDDRLIAAVTRPLSIIIILIGLKLALISIYTKDILDRIFAGEVINTIIIIIITFIFIRVFDIIIESWGKAFAKKTKSDMDDQLLSLFHRFSRIIIVIIAVLFVLQAWGIQIGPLLAGLGIGGIAIAFALQSSLANIFGGISIILDKSVKVGDILKIDDKTSGTVLDVGLRSTKVRTWDNELVIVPNGKMADAQLHNMVQPDPKVRATVEFGVVYGSDHKKVKKIVLSAISKIGHVLKDPEPRVMFISMGDFSLNFRAYFWVDEFAKRFATKEEATCAIYDALNKAKIGIPFPTSTVYIKKN